MCIATLNVSTQPCAHRWYELIRACQPTNNLATCPAKLQLSGWETRTDSCPWCESTDPQESTHRLFNPSATNTPIASSSSSTTSSPPSPDPVLGRTWSWRSTLTTDGMAPLSRHSSSTSSTSSAANDWAQRHREMNERLEIYLLCDPHEVLPSAAKNYPSYAGVANARTGEEGQSVGRKGRRKRGVVRRWRSFRGMVGVGV